MPAAGLNTHIFSHVEEHHSSAAFEQGGEAVEEWKPLVWCLRYQNNFAVINL